METTRIGTRGSALAMAQAHETRDRLVAAHGLPANAFEIVPISTSGDRIQDRPLSEVGGKGLFTKEIEEALLDGRIDFAVHSSKDMATVLPAGLELSVFLPREDPRDAFIGRCRSCHCGAAATAPRSARRRLRRQALLRRMRPDVKVVTFRGNVQTRLRKLEEGQVDGTLLANAGLRRLGLDQVITELLPVESFPPAPGQGAICVETRTGDRRIAELLAPINHAPTCAALACERAFLATLDGSCRTPIAGYATVDGELLRFSGLVITPDGREWYDIAAEGSIVDADRIGRDAGAAIRARAGAKFFEGWS